MCQKKRKLLTTTPLNIKLNISLKSTTISTQNICLWKEFKKELNTKQSKDKLFINRFNSNLCKLSNNLWRLFNSLCKLPNNLCKLFNNQFKLPNPFNMFLSKFYPSNTSKQAPLSLINNPFHICLNNPCPLVLLLLAQSSNPETSIESCDYY